MGAITAVKKLVKNEKTPVQMAANALKDDKPIEKASRMDEEQGAKMRGSRRRGRQLLSDSRLNPETGVETLGGGNNLG
jgi:hypothetical protein